MGHYSKFPKSRIVGSYDKCMFMRNCQTIFQSIVIILHFYRQHKNFYFPYIFTKMWCCSLLNFSHYSGFGLYFLADCNYVELVLMSLVTINLFFCYWFVWGFFFFFPIGWILVLCQTCSLQIMFPVCVLPFWLLNNIFEWQALFIFLWRPVYHFFLLW